MNASIGMEPKAVILMRKTKMNIWGREFKLEIIYDAYKGERILDTQRDALAQFIENESIVNNELDAVKKYCLKDDNMNGIETIENIFKYVIPTAIFVERSEKNRKISLLCNYKWDSEHGLTLSFVNEKLKAIE